MYSNSDYKSGTLKGSASEAKLLLGVNRSNKDNREQDEEKFVMVHSIEEGLRKALDDDYTFIWAADTIDAHVGMECSHVKVKTPFSRDPVSFMMRKDSPYHELFDF